MILSKQRLFLGLRASKDGCFIIDKLYLFGQFNGISLLRDFSKKLPLQRIDLCSYYKGVELSHWDVNHSCLIKMTFRIYSKWQMLENIFAVLFVLIHVNVRIMKKSVRLKKLSWFHVSLYNIWLKRDWDSILTNVQKLELQLKNKITKVKKEDEKYASILQPLLK